ncbi:MAG TPA: matrixin family metalloprotease [Ignavibacteriaceae bacterium]|nr:matrixin family metalloprotease [Ignavibacteriaceae bacterium]
MKVLNRITSALLIGIILFAFTDIRAQRSYYDKRQKSSSLKSSASEIYYPTNNKSTRKRSTEPDLSYSDNKVKNRNDQISETKEIYSENYFRIDKSRNSLWDGKHWEDFRFPLNIYVKDSNSDYFKSSYKDYVKYALDVWRKADDRIMYNFVKSVNEADISVIFVENLGEEYEENYLGLTDYNVDRDKIIDFSKIQISLLKNGNEKVPAGELKATIIHEFGHALGLGHSKNEKDLMYPYISPEHNSEMNYDELSTGDRLAVKTLLDLSFNKKYVWNNY